MLIRAAQSAGRQAMHIGGIRGTGLMHIRAAQSAGRRAMHIGGISGPG
jgi:hypothetical protein